MTLAKTPWYWETVTRNIALLAEWGISAAAQALRGSARGIGAWRIASAAEAVELAAASGAEPELKSAVDRLGVVAEETRAAIAELLQAN